MSDEKYLAFDVHKATTSFAVRDHKGRVIQEGIIATSGDAFLRVLASIPGHLHVTIEEGLHAEWLFDLLAHRVHRFLVCNPRKSKLLSSGSKSDRIDCRKLSKLLLLGELSPVYHGERSLRALQQLVSSYETLVCDCTRSRSRLKALYVGRAIACPRRTFFHPAQRQLWLSKLLEPGARLRAELLFDELDSQTALRKKAKAAMLAECRKHTAEVTVLRSVSGFGPVRVAQLLATVRTPHRFPNASAFQKYVGLAVETSSSSDYEFGPEGLRKRTKHVATRGLTRDFNRRLKNVFKGAATNAAHHGPLVPYYAHLLKRGRKPELARLTLARRLASAVLSLWKSGELFDPRRFLATANHTDTTHR